MQKKIWQYLPLIALLVVVFAKYANTIDDLDLWWNLKHGQTIVTQGHLISQDPFAVTAKLSSDINESISGAVQEVPALHWQKSGFQDSNLKASWLFHVVLYFIYSLGGFVGIGIFKSVIFVATYFLVYALMLRRGAHPVAALLTLVLIAIIGADFNSSRAQLVSFILFPLLLYILDAYARRPLIVLFLPVLMAAWANMHGGFILGEAVILLWWLCEVLQYIIPGLRNLTLQPVMSRNELRIFSAGAIAGMLAGLLGPNGYKTLLFPFLIFKKSLFATIDEYARPQLNEYSAFWIMFALLGISLAVMLWRRKIRLNEFMLSLFLGYISTTGIRFIIFFALGSGIVLSYAVTLFFQWVARTGTGLFFIRRAEGLLPGRAFTILLSVALMIALLVPLFSAPVFSFDMRDSRYPSGAVAFLKGQGVRGNIFNLYDWGGYLIWNLAPDNKVFIDGRSVNELAMWHHVLILQAAAGQNLPMPLWKHLLKAYDIHCIVMSAVVTWDGSLYPLVLRLSGDNDWELVYTDDRSVVFLERTAGYQEIIQKNRLPKDEIVNAVIRECKKGIRENPATPGYYQTIGHAYLKQNRLSEAREAFAEYLERDPNNSKVRNLYDRLSGSLRQHQ